jgi:hypothetical protein
VSEADVADERGDGEAGDESGAERCGLKDGVPLDLPLRLVHPGHGPSFGRDRLHEIIQDYLASAAAPLAPGAGGETL